MDLFPAWSPDGSKIAFSRLVNANEAPSHNRFQIYVMNSDGSNQMRLTNTVEGGNSCPNWSPDGTRIAFTRGGSATDSVYSEIYVMNADGSNQMKLTTSPESTVNYWSAWSRDGRTIAFCRYRVGPGNGVEQGIYLMNSNGSNVRLISRGGSIRPGRLMALRWPIPAMLPVAPRFM